MQNSITTNPAMNMAAGMREVGILLCRALALLVLLLGAAFNANAKEELAITTLAGLAGESGSADGTGSAARFNNPYGVAVDGAGNVYVADTLNHTIRKITSGGVETLAGMAGVPGKADGAGSAARFDYPNGVAVDGTGNLYVADSSNCTIRKITPEGVVSTLAGLAGIAGSADGSGSEARFSSPTGVALDGAGNLYVADTFNDTIRKITPAGDVTTLAGLAGSSGSADGMGSAARFNYPYGVAVDGAGNIYVGDTAYWTIRKITPAGDVITLAGLAGSAGSADGTGSAARFDAPYGVAVDSAGNVYVTDTFNDTIRKITPVGVVSTLAGLVRKTESADGTGSAARFYYPYGVALDSAGNVFIADTNNHTIRKGVIYSPPVITSLIALPNNPKLGETVTFTVVANDPENNTPITTKWNFGDGTFGDGDTVTHFYSALGKYTVIVTVTDSIKSSFSSPINVTVLPETRTDLAKTLSIALNFKNHDSDTVSLAGAVPSDAIFDGRHFKLDIGGIPLDVALDAKGKSPATVNGVKANNTVSVAKPNKKSGLSSYTAKLTKGNFAAAMALIGLGNFTTPKNHKSPASVTLVLYYNGKAFSQIKAGFYAAKMDVSGKF